MKKKDKIVSDVYLTGSSSTSVPDAPESERFDTTIKKEDEERGEFTYEYGPEKGLDTTIKKEDEVRYGKNKPRREIIRGELIHDSQS